jgi:hypothetical protein
MPLLAGSTSVKAPAGRAAEEEATVPVVRRRRLGQLPVLSLQRPRSLQSGSKLDDAERDEVPDEISGRERRPEKRERRMVRVKKIQTSVEDISLISVSSARSAGRDSDFVASESSELDDDSSPSSPITKPRGFRKTPAPRTRIAHSLLVQSPPGSHSVDETAEIPLGDRRSDRPRASHGIPRVRYG